MPNRIPASTLPDIALKVQQTLAADTKTAGKDPHKPVNLETVRSKRIVSDKPSTGRTSLEIQKDIKDTTATTTEIKGLEVKAKRIYKIIQNLAETIETE